MNVSPTQMTKPMTSGCVLKTRFTCMNLFSYWTGRGSVWALDDRATYVNLT